MSDQEKVINDLQRQIEELEERIAIVLEGKEQDQNYRGWLMDMFHKYGRDDLIALLVSHGKENLLADVLKEQEHEVCENCPYKLEDIGDFSDGYHTFNDLYMQRAVLFATIVNQNLDKAWKSHKHEDGEPCFGGGWFIVAVDTPKGSYSYHYEDKYWDIFKCVELPVAKHWDGHTDKDVWRLLLLT